MKSHFILYVADQQQSTEFYSSVFGFPPVLNVPGLTEFHLSETSVLGLMPVTSAARLLGKKVDDLQRSEPKAELYLLVEDAAAFHARALAAGGTEVSPLTVRNWGHRAAYSIDSEGHVLAFAEEIPHEE